MQFVLTEKLDELITKDRFAKVRLLKEELGTEDEVLEFAFEIGQALAAVHTNMCLHRDIKIENIFWDNSEQIYKLGDFGIAKWADDGNAETIVYTDGYGAPEIERRLYDSYNATADIYSLGITLYLLLNELKFPGSEGYYSIVEVQYNPEFVFPAPLHASEDMARVIRKMCSFYPEERYQTMNEVLAELFIILEKKKMEISKELYELAEVATETFREEKEDGKEAEKPKKREKTRAERKEEQKIVDKLYIEDNIKYFFAISLCLILLFKGLQPDSSMITSWLFWGIPVAVMMEALLQKLKEFHIIFGAGIILISVISIISLGLTVPHIILMLCVLIGCPVLTLAGAVSTGIWMYLEYSDKINYLNVTSKYDLGWIILIVTMLMINRYFHMRIEWEKTTYIRAYLGVFIYDKLFIIMTIVGLVLFILQKCNVIVVPYFVERVHLFRTGIISFIVLCVFEWWDGLLDDLNTEKGEELTEDD